MSLLPDDVEREREKAIYLHISAEYVQFNAQIQCQATGFHNLGLENLVTILITANICQRAAEKRLALLRIYRYFYDVVNSALHL